VLIRLPVELRGEVNYLVDDVEHLVVHAGEDQLLRLKGSYEVRFSRGVSEDGRSHGEARYTVTEGVYRFDVSAKGWELYREGEAKDVRTAIQRAEERAAQLANSLPAQSDSAIRSSSESSAAAEDSTSRAAPTPIAPSPAPLRNNVRTTEESLPAPRSILEPS
jgi:hypothetical protein